MDVKFRASIPAGCTRRTARNTVHPTISDTVYDLVMIDLRSVLWNYRHNKKQFKAFLERKFQTDSAKEAKKLQAEYEKKQSRFEEIDRILCKLYEDSALGRIPENRYEVMSAQYESEQR